MRETTKNKVANVREFIYNNPDLFKTKNGKRFGRDKTVRVLKENDIPCSNEIVMEALKKPFSVEITDVKHKKITIDKSFYKIDKTGKYYTEEQLKELGLEELIKTVY